MKRFGFDIEFVWQWTNFSIGLGYVKGCGFGLQIGFLTMWIDR